MYSVRAFYWTNVIINASSSENASAYYDPIFTFLVRQCPLVAVVIIMVAKEEVRTKSAYR